MSSAVAPIPASTPASSAATTAFTPTEIARNTATPAVLGQAAARSVLSGGSSVCGGAGSRSPPRANARSAEPIETRKPKAPTAKARSAGPPGAPAMRAARRPASASVSRRAPSRSWPRTAGARRGAPSPAVTAWLVARAGAVAAAAASTAAAVAVPARRALLARPVRGVLRPLDQLLGLDDRAVLALRDQLEADPVPLLVDLLDEHVQHVAAGDHVLDVLHTAGAHVRDVQQAVGALLQLDEGAEVGRLHDLARVGVPHLGLLRERLDRRDRRVGLGALRRVDEDRAVLLDVDLDVVVALERADGLAALADDQADLLRVDLDRRDAGRVVGQLDTRLRDRLEHLLEDRGPCPGGLLERAAHDLLRDAGDLDVHLQRGDPVRRAGDLEVHVTEVILGALDVGEDDVVVALLDEPHRDAADRCLDRHAGVHERERRAADRAHRRRAVRLERLGDEADRVRELVRRRDHRLQRALCERPVANVTPLRAAHEARLPDRVGREVVVVHVAALVLEREVVDPLPLLGGAKREERHDLRLSAGEEGRPVRARRDADLGVDRADLVGGTTVRATLVDGDLLADELLVDRLAGLLDELLRHRVLRGLALGRTDR